MSDFKTLWQSAKVEPVSDRTYAPIAPGDYHCVVAGGSIDLAKNLVSLSYQIITDGAFCKRRLFSNYLLNSEVGLRLLKESLLALGVTEAKLECLASLDALQSLLNSVVGVACDVTVKLGAKKTNSDDHWLNVYINHALALQPKSSVLNGSAPKLDTDSELPF